MRIRAIFTSGTVGKAFSVAPTFSERANGRQRFRLDCLPQKFGFVLKVTIKPVIADFVNLNDVDGFINAPLGGNAKRSVATNRLNIHAADFETGTFKQKAVVVELDTPIEEVTNAVKAQFGLEFGLPFLEPRLVDFARVDFDFVNAESPHKLEAERNFQVAQHAVISVEDFSEQIELPRRDVIL